MRSLPALPSQLRFSAPLCLLLATTGLAVGCGGDGNDADGPKLNVPNTPTDGENAEEFAESDGGLVELDQDEVRTLEGLSCTGWSAEGESLPAVLQLVVDVSLSMTEDAPGSRQSKWEITQAALSSALSELPPSVAVGVLFYPNMRVSRSDMSMPLESCVNTSEMVPIEMLGTEDSDHRRRLQTAIQRAETNGYTPTHDAYKYALNTGLVPHDGNASKFMLLITDGAPTMREVCNGGSVDGSNENGQVVDQPTAPIIDEIEGALADHDVRTFLIGSPGSEESAEEGGGDMRPWLSAGAVVGGTAANGCEENGPNFCHLDMTQEPDFAAALTEGLSAIAGQIVDSCAFAIPAPDERDGEVDPTLTNLVITWGDGTSDLVRPDNVGDCKQGWRYDDDGNVSLCDDMCDRVKNDSRAQIRLTFGCSSEEIEEVLH